MSALTPAQADFELARDDFLNSLEHPEKYNLSAFTTIKDVHGEIERIQVEQGRKGCLRNLKKIQPYLECITQFSGVIDTFVQVKPDILALIWVCEVVSCPDLILMYSRVLSSCCFRFAHLSTTVNFV